MHRNMFFYPMAEGDGGGGTGEVKYTFKPPDGAKLDDAVVKETETFAKANKLSPEQAQATYLERLRVEGAVSSKFAPPKEYKNLKLMDNALLPQSHVGDVEKFAKEHGLSEKAAQALLENHNSFLGNWIDQQSTKLVEQAKTWEGQLQTKHGDKFAKKAELAKRVVAKYGSKELQAKLLETGYGSYPDLVELFMNVGEAIGESELVTEGTNAAVTKTTERAADVLFGKAAAASAAAKK